MVADLCVALEAIADPTDLFGARANHSNVRHMNSGDDLDDAAQKIVRAIRKEAA